jgi:hypothetical protein
MVPVDRPGIDRHFIGPRYLTQQLTRALPNVANQNRIPVFRDPNQVVLAVKDRVTAALNNPAFRQDRIPIACWRDMEQTG